MFASRLHPPPKPGSVSRVVWTSPSRIPILSLPSILSRVCSNSAVLPAPGELIMLLT